MSSPSPGPGPRYDVEPRPGAAEPVPAVVSLHLFGVPTSAVPRALVRMGSDRRGVRRIPGATFVKLLGTGSGRTFTPRDADPHHWGVLACWADQDGPARFEQSAAYRGWHRIADEECRFLLRPLASRGEWAGRAPFGDPRPHRWDGPVAAVTRARIRTDQWRRFWGAVPPVSGDLRAVAGLRLALGVGEAPVGLQGTFSVWESNAALTEFAHRRSPHVEVMRRTREVEWYAEELFARFALVDAHGTHQHRPVSP